MSIFARFGHQTMPLTDGDEGAVPVIAHETDEVTHPLVESVAGFVASWPLVNGPFFSGERFSVAIAAEFIQAPTPDRA